MANIEWVIDTCILVCANTGSDHRCLDALALLREVLSRHSLALDVEDGIRNEYYPYITRGSVVEQWWIQMNSRGKFVYHSSKLTVRQQGKLRRLKFDADDWKFVGTALKAAGRTLVSHESDYDEPGVPEYLASLKIRLFKVDAALASI